MPFLVVGAYGQESFADFLGHAAQNDVISEAWDLRPSAIVHIGGLVLEDSGQTSIYSNAMDKYGSREKFSRYTSSNLNSLVTLLQSVGEAVWAANSLGRPLFLVVPGGGDEPSTDLGVAAMTMEAVFEDAKCGAVVRVNGLFGPHVENRVTRMVLSDKPMVDDSDLVNPVSERSLRHFLAWVAMQSPERLRRKIRIGGDQCTWYELFSQVHPHVRPWTENRKVRLFNKEMNLIWHDREGTVHPKHDPVRELAAWLRDEGIDTLNPSSSNPSLVANDR